MRGFRRTIVAIVCVTALAGSIWFGGCSRVHSGADNKSERQATEDFFRTRVNAAATAEEKEVIATIRDAVSAALALIEANPGDPRPCHAMALTQYALNRMKEAETWWRRAIERDARFVEPHRWLAYVAMDRGDYAQAAALYRKALSVDPNHADARLGLAEALAYGGNFTEAEELLGDADLPMEAQSAPAFLLLGQINLELKQYAAAKKYFAAAVQLIPAAPEPRYGLSLACLRLGEKGEAEDQLKTFNQLSRADKTRRGGGSGAAADIQALRQKAAYALGVVGNTYASIGQLGQAEECWRRAVRTHADDVESRDLLAGLYQNQQRWEEAAAVLEELAQLDPHAARRHVAFGNVCNRLGKLDAAEKAMREAIRLRPDQPDGWTGLALVLLKSPRSKDAVDAAQKSVELNPSADNYYLLSATLDRVGNRQAAIQAIEQAIRMENANPMFREQYDRLRRGG